MDKYTEFVAIELLYKQGCHAVGLDPTSKEAFQVLVGVLKDRGIPVELADHFKKDVNMLQLLSSLVEQKFAEKFGSIVRAVYEKVTV